MKTIPIFFTYLITYLLIAGLFTGILFGLDKLIQNEKEQKQNPKECNTTNNQTLGYSTAYPHRYLNFRESEYYKNNMAVCK